MATLLARVKVKPGTETRWEEVSRQIYEATHANETAMLDYEYWRASDTGSYYVLFSFKDFDGLMEHQVADYHHNAEYGDIFEDMKMEWLDPVQGASPRPPSVTTGVEDQDRGALWNEYVRRMSKPQPGWWDALRS